MIYRTISLITIFITAFVSADAQISNIANKVKGTAKQEQVDRSSAQEKTDAGTPSGTRGDHTDDEFLYMGRDGLDGKSIAEMRACVPMGRSKNPPPVAKVFRVWSDAMSEVAALRSFNSSDCQVVAFYIQDRPAYKWRNIDSLTETAQGHSIYKTQSGKLVLVRKVEASQFYVVVVPDHNKPGLKLADLRMCGSPDTIKLFRRKVASVSNCHDQKQKLYVFERYKSYPGPMQTGSVIFDSSEFTELNKQGKFRGLVSYKLVGDGLVAVK